MTLHNKVYVCWVLLGVAYLPFLFISFILSLSLTHPVLSLPSYSIVECFSPMDPLADFGRQLSLLVRPA